MKASQVLTAAVLVLVISVAARANFVLSGTQHQDITTSHTTGILYDNSTATVVQGGRITDAYVNDAARLRLIGGIVDNLTAYNTSTTDAGGGILKNLSA